MIVLSAILMGISQHPIGYGFLSFFALIPIIPKLLKLKSYSKAIQYGFVWGFVYNITTLYWISSNIGTSSGIAFFTMILSVIILLSGSVIIFLFWCILNRRGINIWILSFIWPAVELLRSYGTLGFPWVSLSNSLIEYNTVIQNIEYIGMYGVTSWIVIINILIYRFLVNRNYHKITLLGVAILLPLATGTLIKNSYKINLDKEVRIISVQPNVHLSEKWSRGSQNIIINNLIAQTKEGLDENIDMIVWPETSVPSYLMQNDQKNYNKIKLLLSDSPAKLIAGIPYFDYLNNRINHYNSAGYFDKSGLIGLYNKIHLVPGAEYVPLSRYINSLEIFNFGMGNFSHGDSFTLFNLKEYKFSAMICLESIFPQLSREFVREGANFLVYLVNDGWYERAPEPQQHASRAVYRAIETRRPVVRCANTGISMIIDQLGNINHQMKLNKKGNIIFTIHPSDEITFYVKYGDIFIYFMMFVVVLFMFKRIRYEEYV